jgi:hypothetical protein
MAAEDIASRYYESDKPMIKLTPKDFAHDPECEDFDFDINPLVDFLCSIEKKYTSRLKYTKTEAIVDTVICNEIFAECYVKFKKRYSVVIIYDEIVSFFHFSNKDFFSVLCKTAKQALYKKLSETVNIQMFERKSREEQLKRNHGYFQPSFKK